MAEQDNPVFYKLVNSVTGHYYLGATATPIARERDHLAEIRAGKKGKLWQQMWNDHGQTRDDAVWRFHIVRRYPDMEATVRCEHEFLQARVGKDPLCLNKQRTSEKLVPNTGLKHSEENKTKISESLKGKMGGENHPMYGKTLSDEHKAKISEALSVVRMGENNPFYGKTHSAESKEKMSVAVSQALTGKPKSAAHKEALSAAAKQRKVQPFTGKKHSPEAIAKMKAAAARRTPEHCAKLSAAAKLREARKRAEKEAAKSSQ